MTYDPIVDAGELRAAREEALIARTIHRLTAERDAVQRCVDDAVETATDGDPEGSVVSVAAAEDASALDYAFEAWAREHPLWRTTCCDDDSPWDFDPTGTVCGSCRETITPDQVAPIPRTLDEFYDAMED